MVVSFRSFNYNYFKKWVRSITLQSFHLILLRKIWVTFESNSIKLLSRCDLLLISYMSIYEKQPSKIKFFWCSSGDMVAFETHLQQSLLWNPRIRIKKLVTDTNFQNIVEEIGRIKFQNVESRIAPYENKSRSHDFISCQILMIFQPLLINVLF